MHNVSAKKTVVFLTVLAMIAGGLMPLALAFTQRYASAATAPDWVDARGPGNGDAMAMVYDDVHGILYRGTVGSGGSVGQSGKGVWKYQAGTWTSLGGEVAALGINTLAYDSAGDRLYAGSNGRGVWCYNPSAGTWSETNSFMRAYYITSLAFGGGKLYAGVWDPNGNGGLGAGLGVWSYNPDPPGTWTIDTGSVSTFRIEALAWGDGKLYAGCIDRSSGSEIAKGVWYYDPATTTWTDTGGGMANRYSRVLAYDAVNDLLYSGAGFTGVFCYDPDSGDPDKWTNTAGTARFYEVTSLAWGEGKLYAGCNSLGPVVHNVVLCYNPGSGEIDKWTDTGGGMDTYQFPSLAFDTTHHYLYVGTTKNGVLRYDLSNAPPTWGDTRGGVSTSYILSLAYDDVDDLLYVGTINEGVWCYNPATATWTDTGGAASSFQVFSLAWGGGKLYASCFDLNSSTYVGVWCYDPSSPGPDKWTDTGGTEKAVSSLVYDAASDLLYAGTGEYYSDNNGHGVWCYDPASSGWSDISSGDIDTFKIDSMALGGDGRLYAGCYNAGSFTYVGVWYYDLDNPGPGWSNTGGSVSTFTAYSLAWGDGKLYAGCLDKGQPIVDWGQGVWSYDPTGLLPDKWTNTGGSVNNFAAYSLAWGEGKLYASCLNHSQSFDGVWGYDPLSSDADKWTDTGGGVSSYYVSSLLYDSGYHRLYAGSGGMGAWYYGAPPAIDSLDPTSAAVGSEVTINGSSFGPGDSGSEYVTFGAVPAAVKPGTWTDDSVVCYVPAGVAGTVQVTVHNLNGASNPADFNVLPRYAVNASVSGGHGTVTEAAQTIAQGSSATIHINPEAGYHIASITDNGTSRTVANPYVISNVTAAHTVVVTFTQDRSPDSIRYLAEGSTDWGFDCYVSIANPNPTPVNVKLTYMTSSGQQDGPTVPMPARSQATVYPSSTLGAADFSTKVECLEGKTISVDRTMYWTGAGAACPEAHCATGVTSPATTWYLPEGSSNWGFECFLLIQNPNGTAANCQVTWMIEGETPATSNITVPANSRSTLNMADFIGAKDASIKVTSNIPVIPERAMYRDNRREGHDSTGTSQAATDYYLAEGCTGFGFTTYVLVQNPQETPTDVTIYYQTASGPVAGSSFEMPANSRKTVCVNDTTEIPGPNPSFSTRVHGSQPIIAERAMYWNGGPDNAQVCHDSIGLDQPHTSWYLADGQTNEGWETWTLVQNPNLTAVTVEVTYLTPDGSGNVVRTETIAAASRQSFNMAEHSGISGRAAIMVVSKTAGLKIMCERAMYWNSKGAGTDTIGGYSD